MRTAMVGFDANKLRAMIDKQDFSLFIEAVKNNDVNQIELLYHELDTINQAQKNAAFHISFLVFFVATTLYGKEISMTGLIFSGILAMGLREYFDDKKNNKELNRAIYQAAFTKQNLVIIEKLFAIDKTLMLELYDDRDYDDMYRQAVLQGSTNKIIVLHKFNPKRTLYRLKRDDYELLKIIPTLSPETQKEFNMMALFEQALDEKCIDSIAALLDYDFSLLGQHAYRLFSWINKYSDADTRFSKYKLQIIKYKNYDLFVKAVKFNNKTILRQIFSALENHSEIQKMISSAHEDYSFSRIQPNILATIALKGDIELYDYIVKYIDPAVQQDMLAENNFRVMVSAVLSKSIVMVRRIMSDCLMQQKQAMLKAENYYDHSSWDKGTPLSVAIAIKQEAIVGELLSNMSQTTLKKILSHDDYKVFQALLDSTINIECYLDIVASYVFSYLSQCSKYTDLTQDIITKQLAKHRAAAEKNTQSNFDLAREDAICMSQVICYLLKQNAALLQNGEGDTAPVILDIKFLLSISTVREIAFDIPNNRLESELVHLARELNHQALLELVMEQSQLVVEKRDPIMMTVVDPEDRFLSISGRVYSISSLGNYWRQPEKYYTDPVTNENFSEEDIRELKITIQARGINFPESPMEVMLTRFSTLFTAASSGEEPLNTQIQRFNNYPS